MTSHLILNTFNTRTLDLWSEGFSKNNLIDFISTCITCIYCHLHARLHITASCNNTFHWYQWSNWVRFYFSHFCDSFFWVLPIHKYYLVLSFEFRRDLISSLFYGWRTLFDIFFKSCLLILLEFILLMIKSSLLHQNFFRLELWFFNLNGWMWY